MTPKLIGLSGRKRSGKDTVGGFLQYYKYEGYSFAEPLKKAVEEIYNWGYQHTNGTLKDVVCSRHNITPRHALQQLGTNYFRVIDPNFWVNNMQFRLEEPGAAEFVVITDVRFSQEMDMIHSMGGVVWRIERPGFSPSDVHESESALDNATFDATLLNDGTIEDLRAKVERLLNG